MQTEREVAMDGFMAAFNAQDVLAMQTHCLHFPVLSENHIRT